MSREISDDQKKGPEYFYSIQKYDQQKILPGKSQPPAILEQKKRIREILTKKEKIGKKEVWCIIEKRWYDQWKVHVNYNEEESEESGGDAPGPINNETLVENKENFLECISKPEIPLIKLRKNTMENVDYDMIPSEAWDLLMEWFGGYHLGYAPTIARYTFTRSITEVNASYNIDLHPYFLQCGVFDPKKMEFAEVRLCKFTKFTEMMELLKELNDIDPQAATCRVAETRIWVGFLGSPWKVVKNEDAALSTFEEEGMDGRQFILETRNLTETYHLNYLHEEKKKSWQIVSRVGSGGGTVRQYDPSYYRTNRGDEESAKPGVCGLRNLGNTCYMNSATQCLTKVPVLRDYFVSGSYKKEINVDNPLGRKGDVANAFGEIMELMWNGKNSRVAPRGFKHVMGKYREAFAGYGQQDSHELISFLLDAIHEDLNRIKTKPYTEGVDHMGRDDTIVANETWDRYKTRNDSIIVDKFQGLLRSEVQCPKCRKVSVKFDPYTYLSVPVPGVAMRDIKMTVFFLDPKRAPMTYKVKVKKLGMIGTLRDNLSEMCGVPAYRLAISEVFNHKIYIVYSDNDQVKSIKDHETIMAFELDEKRVEEKSIRHGSYERGLSPFGCITLVQKRRREVSYYTYFGKRKEFEIHTKEISDYPLVVYVENEVTTAKEMYDKCFELLLRYLTKGAKSKLKEIGIDIDGERNAFFPNPTKKQLKKYEEERQEIIERNEKERLEELKRQKEKEEEKKRKKEGKESKTEGDKKDDDDKEEDKKDEDKEEDKKDEDKKEDDKKDDKTDGDEKKDDKKDDKPKKSFQEMEKERKEGGGSTKSFQEMERERREGRGGEGGEGGESKKEDKKEEEKEKDEDMEEEKKRAVLFHLTQFPKGCNYHSSTGSKVGRVLTYTDEELVQVPRSPGSGRVTRSYYTYTSTRDKYNFKFEVILPKGFQEYFDKDKMAEKEKHESMEEKKVEKKKKDVLRLEKCIAKFCEKEVLTKENTFYCSRCKEHVEATKKIDIWKLPEVLIVQLKRFQNSQLYSYREKIEKYIEYPMSLNMQQFALDKNNTYKNYKLFAVSNHYGGLGGGHYTAYAKAPNTNEVDPKEIGDKFGWYDFNDSFVKSTTEKDVISKSGYVLFYQAENATPVARIEDKKEEEKKEEKKEENEKEKKEEEKKD